MDCYAKLTTQLDAYECTGLIPKEVTAVLNLVKFYQSNLSPAEAREFGEFGAENLRKLIKTYKGRREGCELCTMPDGTLAKHLVLAETGGGDAKCCPECGRDLRGESHDGD